MKMILEKIDKQKALKYFLLIIIIFILRTKIYLIINIILNLKPLITFLKFKKECIRNNFFKLMNNNLILLKKYKKNFMPKIAIISPIYNRERFVLRFLRNIQFQNFGNIEIIMIDDRSSDKSIDLIEEYRKYDHRIKLIKNKKNKGTFKSRNIGVLFSKTKYVILPDPDDLMDRNILYLCYKYAEKYDFDIIRFNINKVYPDKSFNDLWQRKREKVVLRPELSWHMFYGYNELRISDYYLYNKFIKREIFIQALNSLDKFYYNMYNILWEDTLMSYVIYRTANSYCSLKKTGYYYIKNSQSITNNMHKISLIRMKYMFYFLKLVFESTKNTYFEKNMFNLLFTELNKSFNFGFWLGYLSYYHDYLFYSKTITMFLQSKYISKINRFVLNKILNSLKKRFMKIILALS